MYIVYNKQIEVVVEVWLKHVGKKKILYSQKRERERDGEEKAVFCSQAEEGMHLRDRIIKHFWRIQTVCLLAGHW